MNHTKRESPIKRAQTRVANLWRDILANEGGPKMEWRTTFILLVTPVLLTIFYYWGRTGYFRSNHMGWAASTFGGDWPYLELVPYGYWATASLVLRVLVPVLLVVLVLREHPRDYGFKLRGTLRHAPIYLALLLFMLPILYWISGFQSFLDKYPFYRAAQMGGWHFWAYEFFYFVQFFSLEAFFRGFMLFGLRKRFGYYSVIIMTIPYCMIHFGKPFSESLSSIVAGLVLGTLALRSGSFYFGVILHFAVAIALDLLAIWRLGALG